MNVHSFGRTGTKKMRAGIPRSSLRRKLGGRDGVRPSSAKVLVNGFTLLEVLIAMALLTGGLLTILSLLQRTLQLTERIEFETRAAFIAQHVLESLRAHTTGELPFVPGLNPTTWPYVDLPIYPQDQGEALLAQADGTPYQLPYTPFVFSVPGNGVDDDQFFLNPNFPPWTDNLKASVSPDRQNLTFDAGQDSIDDFQYQLLAQGFLRDPASGDRVAWPHTDWRDFDGGIEADASRRALGHPSAAAPGSDEDGDGVWDETGDSFVDYSITGQPADPNLLEAVFGSSGIGPDGDFSYDPQRGIDEEFADGLDNDGDGLIDEDLRLTSQQRTSTDRTALTYLSANPYDYEPWLAGNGLDDDRDSDDWQDTDGINGRSGGDLGVWLDPRSGRALVVSDGIDNDGDGQIDEGIDEEVFNGLDDDGDGLVDEDTKGAFFPFQAFPLPSPNEGFLLQLRVKRVQGGGDGIDDDGDIGRYDPLVGGIGRGLPGFDDDFDGTIDNEGESLIDEEFYNMLDDDDDGLIDEDLRAYALPRVLQIGVFIFQGDNLIDDDGDGWIDEEADDGIDNDRDGSTDEDIHLSQFSTTASLRLPEKD